ncbi:unnamed protein product [Thelazia callipaeda]|uniref:UBX domain-containing protein n=1 Tax=Thelazia callipaeda TaxID=103827 RepID=A0A0N5CLR6_THECL|nr:unnamed protein product [Thelazia callipaeda]
MDRLKKFVNEKKIEKSFKKAGVGHRLTDDSSVHASNPKQPNWDARFQPELSSAKCLATSDIAAEAAYKRMNVGTTKESLTQRNIRLRALKELEAEKKGNQQTNEVTTEPKINVKKDQAFEHGSAISGVYFTCDILGDAQLTKSEVLRKVEEFLRSRMDQDPMTASSLMIFTLNSYEKIQICSATIQKYLQNLIECPDEAKYRRIRLNNKAFQERVLSVCGGKEFLLASGFEEMELSVNEQKELFLVMTDESVMNLHLLIQAVEFLQAGKAVPIKLSRNMIVYKLEPNQVITNPQLPHEFFELDAAEIKKEQLRKEADVEKLLTLRTEEMRNKDKILRNNRYKYTLIRIRFPDRFLLQGTFRCCEPFSAVRNFVEQHLSASESIVFDLIDPVSGKIISDYTKTLSELSLFPAAVLHFEWDVNAHQQKRNTNKVIELEIQNCFCGY